MKLLFLSVIVLISISNVVSYAFGGVLGDDLLAGELKTLPVKPGDLTSGASGVLGAVKAVNNTVNNIPNNLPVVSVRNGTKGLTGGEEDSGDSQSAAAPENFGKKKRKGKQTKNKRKDKNKRKGGSKKGRQESPDAPEAPETEEPKPEENASESGESEPTPEETETSATGSGDTSDLSARVQSLEDQMDAIFKYLTAVKAGEEDAIKAVEQYLLSPDSSSESSETPSESGDSGRRRRKGKGTKNKRKGNTGKKR